MVRMSDLVRGMGGASAGAPPTPPTPELPPEPPSTPPAADACSNVPATPPLPAAAPPPSSDEAPAALFAALQRQLVEVHDLVVGGAVAFPWDRLESTIEAIGVSLAASDDLFWIAATPSATPGLDYLALHQARVAVLALRIGATLRYDRLRLLTLGTAACLMDVALWTTPDALAADAGAVYQAHPRLSADIVRRWAPPSERIVTLILEHHERERGLGFPQGLDGPSIDPDAKILGLLDTYATLTLPPAPHPRRRPHEAIREIVKARQDAFAPALVKALLAETSVFPPGTVVRLNTDEIGRVIAVNRNHPLRPKLEIIANSKGYRALVAKTLDLSEAPFLYITGPVTEAPR